MSELVVGVAPTHSVGRLLEEMTAAFRRGSAAEPENEAREIVAALFDSPRSWPFTHRDVAVDGQTLSRARRALERRLQGAPLAYAVGRASFRHLTLAVDERVLIPRPETEMLVDLVLEQMAGRDGGVAIDVGTGSGAIALALAMEGSFAEVYATDVSRDALDVARRNVKLVRARLRSPVHVVHGSLLLPARHLRARVVVSNPPYIAFSEATALPASVRDWEPPAALFSGTDGMAVTASLVRQAADVLEDGGLLAIEVDARRASLVAEIAACDRRYESVRVRLDLTGRERFVLARRRGRSGDDRG